MKSMMKKLAAGMLTLALAMSAFCFPAFASTAIKSVSIKIESTPQAGMTLDELAGEIRNYVTAEGDHYTTESAEVVYTKDKIIAIGDEVKVKVVLNATGDAYFYTASKDKVHISGGTFVSATRRDSNETLEVTLKLKPAKGNYDPPASADWSSSLGHAKWEAGDSTSGHYDIVLLRGTKSVYTVSDYKGTSFNFYPWMTKKGDYSFKVRTVPHTDSQKKYGKKSEYTESEEVYVDEKHVSDGTGQNTGAGGGVAGWIANGGSWYYVYPDGTMVKNGWAFVNNKWYLFDKNGIMLTGWQDYNGNTYYLDATSGEMKTGWIATTNGAWYYLNPLKGGPEGAMVKNAFIQDGRNTYYLTPSGVMATGWYQISGNMYYFYPQAGAPMGAMARNTTIDTFYVDQNGIWRK